MENSAMTNNKALEAALDMCTDSACTFSMYEDWVPTTFRQAACVLTEEIKRLHVILVHHSDEITYLRKELKDVYKDV